MSSVNDLRFRHYIVAADEEGATVNVALMLHDLVLLVQQGNVSRADFLTQVETVWDETEEKLN